MKKTGNAAAAKTGKIAILPKMFPEIVLKADEYNLHKSGGNSEGRVLRSKKLKSTHYIHCKINK